jgi:TetR/AcrR family transcriptional regulator, repressor of the ameABC operon
MISGGLDDQRERIAQFAYDLIRLRLDEVTPDVLAAEAGISRHRLEVLFPDEADLFEAVAELWFRPLTAMMEEVLASDLPANRKMYEFFARRFVHLRRLHGEEPAFFRLMCDLGTRHIERIRSHIDLADHYLCELIAQAQHEGYFEGLAIDRALSLINQMVACYTLPDMLPMVGQRLSEDKLAAIIDTLFAGLSASDGGARGIQGLRAA